MYGGGQPEKVIKHLRIELSFLRKEKQTTVQSLLFKEKRKAMNGVHF